MKNKKLFAILTLVCFMMTLMPVAAFAAATDTTDTTTGTLVAANAISTKLSDNKLNLVVTLSFGEDGAATSGTAYIYAHQSPARRVGSVDVNEGDTSVTTSVSMAELNAGDMIGALVADATGSDTVVNVANQTGAPKVTAAQMEAYRQAQAEAGRGNKAVADISALVANDGNQSVTLTKAKKGIDFTLTALDADEYPAYFDVNTLYVWAKDKDGNVTSALTDVTNGVPCSVENVYVINVKKANEAPFVLKFGRAGEYTVYAGYAKANGQGEASAARLSDITVIGTQNKITVSGAIVDPDNTYTAQVATVATSNDKTYTVESNGEVTAQKAAAGQDLGTLKIVPNNVQTKDITITFKADGKALKGKTVAIDTDTANVTVTPENATTNSQGKIQIKVSASREGNYNIYFEVDGVQFVLAVVSGNTSAAYITTADQPKAPIAQFEGISGDISFEVTDINGNIVKKAAKGNEQGMSGIFEPKEGYLIFTEKPASTNLENEDLSLKWDPEDQDYDLIINTLDAEGTYAVKAVLDNGAVATAKWEVKRFQTPVALNIECARTVELGKNLTPTLKYVDENGVTKVAKDAKLSATGYAIYSFDGKKITLKTDEKYAGDSIKLVAVSERYNLVGSAEVKIAAEVTDIAFETKSLEVNVNNKVVWNVVDSEGNKVKLDKADKVLKSVNYVVLDKPEGAKVSVYDMTGTAFDGEGKMAITSDTIGNVAVQVVVQVEVNNEENVQNNTTLAATQTKYYTGTQIFAVGNGSVGDVVVMSIGSHEIIVNDAKATIDAAPMIQNDRTFVPFRALAEAFGAEVAYDEATQAVTAKLNGVEVVMTIGSATYTVNGAEKTADVAPFINGSRTMVPVRFAAEAFGIKVIPTYNPDGTTADILFNL